MNSFNIPILAALLLIAAINTSNAQKLPPHQYPHAQKGTDVDDYFGTKVNDPYRWLENDKMPEVEEWVRIQNKFSENYISKITSRIPIKRRLTQLWNFPKKSVPTQEGNLLFYTANNGIQNQSVLFMENLKTNDTIVLLDPNTMSPDGTIALSAYKASKNGKYLALILNKSGSDWAQIRVMDVNTKKLLNDSLEWVKFSGIAWKGNGFYYSRYDQQNPKNEFSKANEYHKIYYHKIGDIQGKDVLVYENKKFPKRNYSAEITEDESYLIISESESTSGNALYGMNLQKKSSKIIPLTFNMQYDYEVVGKIGERLIVRTNFEFPTYKLAYINLQQPDSMGMKECVAPQRSLVLQSALLLKDYIVVKYMENATNSLVIYDINGREVRKMELPALGSVGGLSGQANLNEFYYSFTSFTIPNQVFYSNLDNKTNSLWFKSTLNNINPEDYVVKQVFYPSIDNTSIPMFIIHKQGIELNGNTPTLLYGYGGFNISLTPSFSISKFLFIENGGVYAVANIRGGGEYGEDWHKAGTKENKQNVFNDFFAAAEYLMRERYTSPEKLAIQGGSNGGLLVGACMTQRPELFKVALPAVGVLDMLRYHKFTIGWAWETDYGSSEDQQGFEYLYAYSPLHNIKPGNKYPATLITTADHDDRVVPAHSFKFAATLQEINDGDNPMLIRIDTKAGHGAGKPTSKAIDEATDVMAFTFYNLGMKFISPEPLEGDPVLDIEDPYDPRRDEPSPYLNDPVYQRDMPQKAPKTQPVK